MNGRLYFLLGIFCWGGTYETNINPIFIQQKKFIRIICKKSRMEHSHPLFIFKRILPLKYIFVHKVLRIFYLLSGNVPAVFNEYKARLRIYDTLIVPKPNFTFFTKCFSFLGPKMYNQIPDNIRKSKNLQLFSRNLKYWLLTCETIDILINIFTKCRD